MRDFADSTLWRISAYERLRAETGGSGFTPLEGESVLSSTLHGELRQLIQQRQDNDAVEVVAACLRQRESALIMLRLNGLVWPLTLFPQAGLYHLPRSIIEPLQQSSRDLCVVAIDPPGLRPPGHFRQERVADGPAYHPLSPLLWALALHAPRAHLLREIAGRAAYRLATTFDIDALAPAGAIQAALRRLRLEIASLPAIARWPGMDAERAARLLNGVYLLGGLIVLRTHPAARDADEKIESVKRWLRSKR